MKCPEEVVKKKFDSNIRGFYRRGSEPKWDRLLDFLDEPPLRPFRVRSTRQVFKFEVNGQTLFVKRYTGHRHFKKWLAELLPVNYCPGVREFIAGLVVGKRGFNTVPLIGALARRSGVEVDTSIIVTGQADGVCLDQIISEIKSRQELIETLRPVLKDIKRMHQRGIYFGGAQPQNVFRKGNGENTWFDFEDTKIDPVLSTGWLTDLRRFVLGVANRLPENFKSGGKHWEIILQPIRELELLSPRGAWILCASLAWRLKDVSTSRLWKAYNRAGCVEML